MSISQEGRDYPLCEFLSDLRDVRRLNTGRRYAFILGSGASVPSEIPTGQGLVTNWIKEIYVRAHPRISFTQADDEAVRKWATAKQLGIKGFTYDSRAEFYGKVFQRRFRYDSGLGQAYLRDVMSNKQPSFGYSVLAQLVAQSEHRLVITTNFDHLLEEALKRYGQKEPLVCNHEDLAKFTQNPHDGAVIAKIHGDIQFKTYNAEAELQKLKTQWEAPLVGLLQNYTPIFIGYGGNDPGFMDFLHELPAGTFRHGLIWTHRPRNHPQKTERIQKLVEKFQGHYVAIPGFDEFMFLLGDVFELKKLDTQMEADATHRVTQYRTALDKAIKELRDVRELPGCTQFQDWVGSAVTRLLGEEALRTWRDWHSDAEKETFPAKKREIYQAGLKQLPASPELLSLYAAFLAANFGLIQQNSAEEGPEAIAKRALELAEKQYGAEHPSTLLVTNNLADLLGSKGDWAAAEPHYRRALDVRQSVLGAEHPDTLTSVDNLACLLRVKGEFSTAEPLYRRALEARERVLGPEHPATLGSLNNLAAVLDSKGELAAAEPLYRRALEAFERVLGPEHPDTLTSVNNLAAALDSKGDLAGAEPLYRRALEIRERVLGPEHPKTLTSVNNLAYLLQAKGELANAEPLYRRALTASERVHGTDHPDTLTSVNNLGHLLMARGDLLEALPLFDRAVQGMLQKLGPDHPNTKLVQGNLAQCRAKLAEKSEL